MTRILAIFLVLLIGAPNCWCCVLKRSAAQPPLPECCKMSQEAGQTCPLGHGSNKPKNSNDDSCGCDLSKTKRDMGAPLLALPAPVCSSHDIVEELLKGFAAVKTAGPPRLVENEDPPLNACPLYVSHCALRP